MLVQEEVQKGLMAGFQPPKRVSDRIATLRFYKGKPVVWYGNVRELKTKDDDERVSYMDIKLYGEEKVLTIKYLDFLNKEKEYSEEVESYEVSIKSQKVEEIYKSYGRRMAENPNPARDPATGQPLGDRGWQSKEIEMEVVGYKYTAVVEVNDGPHKGEEFTLSTACLNQ